MNHKKNKEDDKKIDDKIIPSLDSKIICDAKGIGKAMIDYRKEDLKEINSSYKW